MSLSEGDKLSWLNIVRSNIEFHKRQQWTISYYTIILNGAIIGLLRLAQGFIIKIDCLEKGLLSGVSILFTTLGTIALWLQHNSINVQRTTSNHIINSIESDNNCLNTQVTAGNLLTSIFLCIAILFSLIAVFWIIYRI